MINIKDKHNCCGCTACQQSCPKQCINMEQDNEGFIYPIVNKNHCIDCGLCEKVCPCINQNDEKKPLEVYAAQNDNDDIRIESSSGGLFSILAEFIIKKNGVVFGARYDKNWDVIHDYTETLEGLTVFRGSKYVQSYIGNNYMKVREFLNQDRYVLFSGTPCQVSGLKRFLRKEYNKLYTVEVVCHGVPSPKVWRSYLKYINPNNLKITKINLRDKSRGWKQYSYLIEADNKKLVDNYAYTSLYLLGFVNNLTIRPSCYRCPAKKFKSGSDITLADCWGIEQKNDYNDDNKGVSTIIINSKKTQELLRNIMFKKQNIDYAFVKKNNPSIEYSSLEPYCRYLFWKKFPQHGINAIYLVDKKLKANLFFRLHNKIMSKIKNRHILK